MAEMEKEIDMTNMKIQFYELTSFTIDFSLVLYINEEHSSLMLESNLFELHVVFVTFTYPYRSHGAGCLSGKGTAFCSQVGLKVDDDVSHSGIKHLHSPISQIFSREYK